MKRPAEKTRESDGWEDGTESAFPPPTSPAENGDQTSSEERLRRLALQGFRDAQSWKYTRSWQSCEALIARLKRVFRIIRDVAQALRKRQANGECLGTDETWFLENARLMQGISNGVGETLRSFRGPSVFEKKRVTTPRAFAIAVGYLEAVETTLDEESLRSYLSGVQQAEGLRMAELWALKPMLGLALLEEAATQASAFGYHRTVRKSGQVPLKGLIPGHAEKALRSLQRLEEIQWKIFFEENSAVESVLKQDPSGAYPRMDYQSRQMYRKAVEELAVQSLFSEEEAARHAVLLATRAKTRAKKPESRLASRRSHVGYYLIDAGRQMLKRRLGCKPRLRRRFLDLVLEWPELYYVVGVELTTIALVYFLLRKLGILIPFVPGFLLLIPASHAAVGLINQLTSILVRPRQIPKLDFSDGIPSNCKTLVAVPCLLLSEAEIRRNVEALEVRYLGNRDPNLYFALLTDPPDASQPFDEHDNLVGQCSALIENLNEKYSRDGKGSFFHLHRHRVYNPQEEIWMAWERKRGKLMDLNNLLRNNLDSFPIKVGDVTVLAHIRYVITLDSDTQLPPQAAHRLIGALAHPLNQAVVDPRTNTVVAGYGILQPRVGVSIESASQSRLAALYSGQTGFDVYTHAASDVYQDLFGEGSFTGKGIYEVDTFLRVLGERFPTNALLSHDLIEGAYARAGLVTDIEVIDDYPSHFSAYCRRLHRWVRGDWQIMRWITPRVPDSYGRLVPNPLPLLSRWKIFDNLRRSLNDVGLFLLLILGWVVLPGGPVYWTFVTLGLLLLPTYSQFASAMTGLRGVRYWRGFLRERLSDLVTGHLQVFIMLVFLPHQALVMLDAILRTLTRLTITHRNLLEWETAAEAEQGLRKTPVETYLKLTPWISLAIGLILAAVRPMALLVAAPILALWLCAGFFTRWVNRQPGDQKEKLTSQDEAFLHRSCLLTWRYFREFSNDENHWLIPDNVQEEPLRVAARLSPTNLGLLLDARLAAYEMGYTTLEEYAQSLEQTLETVRKLPRYNGHFFNWYDTRTLQQINPLFLSTVDNGNLAASLWTLKQSCLSLGSSPLLPNVTWQGMRDHFSLLGHLSEQLAVATRTAGIIEGLRVKIELLGENAESWVSALPWLELEIQQAKDAWKTSAEASNIPKVGSPPELAWWLEETELRLRGVREWIERALPWESPEYKQVLALGSRLEQTTLDSLSEVVSGVAGQLTNILNDPGSGEAEKAASRLLRRRLPTCVAHASRIRQSLQKIAEAADLLVEEMDFRFLYNPGKKLFSIGYNVETETLEPYCYDLLASEARMAVFIAIAKGEVNQESWFRLGRSHTLYLGKRVLLSWSGTVFEYLMPALWMRSFPGTILEQSERASVVCQQKYARERSVPWGISEAAYCMRDPDGVYQYKAFGVPGLALDPHSSENLVVSPYSSFLSLHADPKAVVRNLEDLSGKGCQSDRGFYDSCHYVAGHGSGSRNAEIVRCWMAHHQGMSLVAACNFLHQSCIQRYFHREPRVKAAELLLHEKVPLSVPVSAESARASEGGTALRLRKLRYRAGSSSGEKSLPSALGEHSRDRTQCSGERNVRAASDGLPAPSIRAEDRNDHSHVS
jgi:cyclic beta-1,2-glucan synthetase